MAHPQYTTQTHSDDLPPDHPFAVGRCIDCDTPRSAVYCVGCHRRKSDAAFQAMKRQSVVLAERNIDLQAQNDRQALYIADLERRLAATEEAHS